jgi:hypothetical protein
MSQGLAPVASLGECRFYDRQCAFAPIPKLRQLICPSCRGLLDDVAEARDTAYYAEFLNDWEWWVARAVAALKSAEGDE